MEAVVWGEETVTYRKGFRAKHVFFLNNIKQQLFATIKNDIVEVS